MGESTQGMFRGDKMNQCKCDKCKRCCKNIPGIPTPVDVISQAKFLKMSITDYLKKHCIIGYRDGIFDKNILFIYPARKGFEGKVETFSYPLDRGDCTFFNNGLCDIHPVKPTECRLAFACKENQSGRKIRNNVLKSWLTDKIHPDIKKYMEAKRNEEKNI